LGAVQSLNLALLVHAQHQRVLGRVQVQTDDVLQFLGERWVVADLEVTRKGGEADKDVEFKSAVAGCVFQFG
jgi:hypothetical protein